MTETMKKYLTKASVPGGTAMMGFADHKVAYFERNWVRLAGYRQNSTTPRFVITEEGMAALAAEV